MALIQGIVDTQKQNLKSLGIVNSGDDLTIELEVKQNGVNIEFVNPIFELLATKSDGTRVRQLVDITYIGNVVNIIGDEQLVTSPGIVTLQLIIKDNKRSSTCLFYFMCGTSLDRDIIQSISKVEVLNQLDEYVVQAFANLKEYEQRIIASDASIRNLNEDMIKAEKVRVQAEINRGNTFDNLVLKMNNAINAAIATDETLQNNEIKRIDNYNTLKAELESIKDDLILLNNNISKEEEKRVQAEIDRVNKALEIIEKLKSTNDKVTIAEAERVTEFNNIKSELTSLKEALTTINNIANSNEEIRKTNESGRVAAEQQRVTDFEKIKSDNTSLGVALTKKVDDKIVEIEANNNTFKQGINEQYETIASEFDKAVANVTNGNENVTNSEIVQARGKEVNLNARLTKFDSQLDTKANQRDLDVEKGRIDTLMSLPDGSTTNDARLEDICVGFDSYVYPNPGDAVRNQCKKIKKITDDIVDTSEIISRNVVNLSDNAVESKGCTLNVVDEIITINGTATAITDLNLNMNFLNNGVYTFKYEILEGSLSGSIQFCYQSEKGFALIENGVTVNITDMNRSKIRILNGTTCENLKIHLWAWSGDTVGEWEPYGTYTTVALNPNLKIPKVEDAFEKSIESYKLANENKKKFEKYIQLENLNIETLDNAYVLAHNGTIQSSNGFKLDKFKLKQGEKLTLNCIAGQGIATISIWNKGYNIMLDTPCVAIDRNQATYTYIATKKEEYVAVCGRTNEGEFSYFKEIEPIMNMNQYLISYIDSLQYNNLFSSFYFKGLKGIAIGDSLTHGVVDGTTGASKNTDKNYPYFLSKMLGCTIEKDGHPGIDASGYYNKYGSTKDYSEYDFAIVFLGTNYGLTDTLDNDTNNAPYADTDTGCYCKLIEKIKTDNPNCKIILCQTYTTVGNENIKPVSPKKVTNKVISQIAEKYNLISLDLDIEPLNLTFVDGVIHQFDKTHLGVGGYLFLASEIAKKLSQQIIENLGFINDIY